MPPSIRHFIESQIEDTQPQGTIREYFRAYHGKAFSERDVAKLRQMTGNESLRLDKEFGNTRITWIPSGGTVRDRVIGLLIANSTTGLTVDAAFLEVENPYYFAALNQRNAQRAATLSNPERLAAQQKALTDYLEARELYLESRKALYAVIPEPDGHAFRKAFLGDEG